MEKRPKIKLILNKDFRKCCLFINDIEVPVKSIEVKSGPSGILTTAKVEMLVDEVILEPPLTDIGGYKGEVEIEPGFNVKKLKRKQFKVNNGTYKKLTDAYQQYKGIKLEGAEYGEVKRAIKTMLYSGRLPEDITNFMKFCADICRLAKNDEYVERKFGWLQNWTILTIKRKLPEFLAGKFEIKKFESKDFFMPGIGQIKNYEIGS